VLLVGYLKRKHFKYFRALLISYSVKRLCFTGYLVFSNLRQITGFPTKFCLRNYLDKDEKMYQFVAQSALRQVHILIQSHSSDSVINCFLYHIPVSTGPFHFFFNNKFYNAVLTQKVTSPVSLPSFYVCRIFLSYFILCKT
jgi:hypothetical protein